jgi:hypothetical protein
MDRKAASPSADRIIADTGECRDDSRLLWHEGFQRRARAARIGCRKPYPTPNIDPDKTNPHVVDGFPQAIPVLERELDAIETYLGRILDQMLGRKE